MCGQEMLVTLSGVEVLQSEGETVTLRLLHGSRLSKDDTRAMVHHCEQAVDACGLPVGFAAELVTVLDRLNRAWVLSALIVPDDE
jgi:hypothetical protein